VLEVQKKLNNEDKIDASVILQNIGATYASKKEFDLALSFFF